MQGNTFVRQEKIVACLKCRKRTVHVKTSSGWVCLPEAKARIEKERNA